MLPLNNTFVERGVQSWVWGGGGGGYLMNIHELRLEGLW